MKNFISKLAGAFLVQDGSPSLVQAQHGALARQMPLMYFILVANTWALAATHMTIAPAWLTLCFPGILTAASAVRVLHWLRSIDIEQSPDLALAELKRTNRLACVVSVLFAGWSFLLVPYGDAFTQSHVAFYMAITVIACIFCLMHLRSAAFIVTVIVNGAFVAYFAMSGQPTFIAIAINMLLVSVGMLTMLRINYDTFSRMIRAQDETLALSAENLQLANIDSLTGLPNRRAFFAHLASALGLAQAENARLAVGIIDLDGFKPVNDLYGHSVGDRLLVSAGVRLASRSGISDLYFARLGGDEFAFVWLNAPDDDAITETCDEICGRLREMFILADATVQISGTIGVATYPEIATLAGDLFDRADYALFHGKRTTRGKTTLFTGAHHQQIHKDAQIEQALRQAELDAELSVVFQPIVDIGTDRTVAFEALARWHNPALGWVSPDQFIPIAERAGIVGSLTHSLLRKALSAAGEWPSDVRLSFNLSAQDLNTPEAVLTLVSIIQRSGVDSGRIDLEITETAFAHDFSQVQKSVDTLRLLGCGISLDDFGTGYSSLTKLHALPLTKFKIDRSFVRDLHLLAPSYKIVKSLLALSRDMELDCVVEGVETEAELATLRDLGAHFVQGYYFSKAISQDEVPSYLGSHPNMATAARA